MHKRKLLVENEWIGFVMVMRAAFRKGTISEYWKTIEQENWFDPEFQDFIDNDIIGQDKLKGANKVKEAMTD